MTIYILCYSILYMYENSKNINPSVEYINIPDEEDFDDVELKKIKKYSKNNIEKDNFGRNLNILTDDDKKEIQKLYLTKDYITKIPIEKEDEDNNEEDEEEEDIIGPLIPEVFKRRKSIFNFFPIKNNITLNLNSNKEEVTSLSIDKLGKLLLSSNSNGKVYIWDYDSLNRSRRPTNIINVSEDYYISGIDFNITSGFFIVGSSNSQAKIYRRDGNFEVQCVKGDLYINDLYLTNGHTLPITDCHFSPIERHTFLTSSRDSTMRIWDMNSSTIGLMKEIKQTTVFKAKSVKNQRLSINSCSYNPYGRLIIGGVTDGSLQFFDIKVNKSPQILINNAHDQEITCIKVLNNNQTILSRGLEGCIKIWDIRNTKSYLNIIEDLYSSDDKSSFSISPCEKYLIGYSSSDNIRSFSTVKLYKIEEKPVKLKEFPICKERLISTFWSSSNNQLVIGTNKGTIYNFYNQSEDLKIVKGIEKSSFKLAKSKEIEEFQVSQPIFTPSEEPLFNTEMFTRQELLEKLLPDKKNPSFDSVYRPKQGPNSKNYKNYTLLQSVENINYKKLYQDMDIVELLKQYDTNNINGSYVNKAYEKTMPKPIFDYESKDSIELEYYKKIDRKICNYCGLKNCTCKNRIVSFSEKEIKKK